MCQRRGWTRPAGEELPPKQLGHSLPVGRAKRHIGVGLDGVHRVGHGHADLAYIKKAVVVFRVAHADGVVCREPKVVERLEYAAALGHTGGQYHQFGPVPDQLAVEAQHTDHLQRGRFVGRGASNQHLPVAVRDAPLGKGQAHRPVYWGSQ